MDHLPGVILLGVDSPIGLGMIRELGSHGVPVHGLGGKTSISRVSRYLASFATREKEPRALVAQLRAISAAHNAPFVMTVSETDIALLNEHAAALAPIKALIPKSQRFERVISKERAIEAATALDIRVPRTIQPVSPRVPELASDPAWRYPVVLKWANPHEVREALESRGLRLDKALFCFSPDDVRKYLEQFVALGKFPLIQEYCKGVGLGQFIFMHEGKPLQTFQHQRLREWPPEGGGSTACKALCRDDHQALMQRSIALLRALEWEGVAMVEYRYDPLSHDAVFMEINGRFWGSFPLAVACRADFAWLQYSVFGLEKIPKIASPCAGKKCRFMIPEAKRLARVLFQPDKIIDPLFRVRPAKEVLDFFGDFFSPRTCYFVFRWDDPKPFLADMANLVTKLFADDGTGDSM